MLDDATCISEALLVFLHTFFFLSLDWKNFIDPSPSLFILSAYSLNAMHCCVPLSEIFQLLCFSTS